MTQYNITNFNLEFISFEQVYKEDSVKLSCLVATSLSCFATIPLTYGIVWYEKNRHYRTLINMLAASICIYQINWLIVAYLFAIIHLIFGPTGIFLCSLELMLINVTAMQIMFLITAIILSKYVFVFHLQNPRAIQEDFYFLFINLSTLSFSFLSQLVQMLLPGKNVIYYICMGSFPANRIGLDLPVKYNYPIYLLFLLTVIIHVLAGIKLKSARKHGKSNMPQASGNPQRAFQFLPSKKQLANLSTNVITIFVTMGVIFITMFMNKMKILEVTKYSNIVAIYFWNWCLPQLMAYCAILVYYWRQEELRNEVRKVAKSFLTKLPIPSIVAQEN